MTTAHFLEPFTWSTRDRQAIESATAKLAPAARAELLEDLRRIVEIWRTILADRRDMPSAATQKAYGSRLVKGARALRSLLESPPTGADGILGAAFYVRGRLSVIPAHGALIELARALSDLERAAGPLANIRLERGRPSNDYLQQPLRHISDAYKRAGGRPGVSRGGPFDRVATTCLRCMGQPTADLYPHIKAALAPPVD